MAEVQIYKPSVANISKYSIYLKYFLNYIKHGDFRSLWASLVYVTTHKLPDEDFKVNSPMGKFIIRKNTTDFQFINYAYESSIKDYLMDNINTFDVFIDLGACIGEYCIWLAGKGKKCIAVEPVNFEALKRNIDLNAQQDKIMVFNCGVGEVKENVFFDIPESVKSSSHINRESVNTPNVLIDTLDNIVKVVNLNPYDRIIMKLDVEGMEPEAIRGGREFIEALKNLKVIYEHFPEDNFRNDKCLLEICKFDFVDLDGVNRLAIKTS